jgi:CDP-diacylglycerol--glycerol-3-phosphate 3-phosphatidyltransferase
MGDRVALSLMFWAFASDVADGYIARRTGARSRLGAVLDPVADKVLIGCILTTLVIVRSLPIWAAGIIILRDMCILIVSAWFIKVRGTVLESNYLGKAAGLAFAVTIALYTLRIQSAGLVMALISVGVAIAAGLSYLTRFARLLRGRYQ